MPDLLCPQCGNLCVETHKFAHDVELDATEGAAAGVDGTPAFFINGIKHLPCEFTPRLLVVPTRVVVVVVPVSVE